MSTHQLPGGSLAVRRFLVIALALAVGAILFLLARCSSQEALQMLPSPMPAASSSAIASSSAQVVATQSVRVTVRRLPRAGAPAMLERPQPNGVPLAGRGTAELKEPDDLGEEIVIEVSQAIATDATTSAVATSPLNDVRTPLGVDTSEASPGHGRLGVIAATMPGILAADLQLWGFDASAVSRSLLGVDLEVGADVAGNLEAGAVGATVGGKAFAGGYAWTRWNLSAQGVAISAGLRF